MKTMEFCRASRAWRSPGAVWSRAVASRSRSSGGYARGEEFFFNIRASSS